jgi:redox-sensitive bicupin YhaK (pirin superfamily)
MITIRSAETRGHASFGWLDTWHTFSFGQYYDPKHMGFGALNPLNEGDGAAITGETSLTLNAAQPAEVLLFDLQ